MSKELKLKRDKPNEFIEETHRHIECLDDMLFSRQLETKRIQEKHCFSYYRLVLNKIKNSIKELEKEIE